MSIVPSFFSHFFQENSEQNSNSHNSNNNACIDGRLKIDTDIDS